MINFNKYPFFRILVPFGLGIYLALNWYLTPYIFQLLIFTGGLLISFFVQILLNKSYRFRWLVGVNVIFLMILAGILNVVVNETQPKEENILKIHTAEGPFIARIIDVPIEREATVKATLELIAISNGDSILRIENKVLAYFQKVPHSSKLNYGDIISFTTSPKTVESPKNPGQFDYKKYLSDKAIYFQVYLKEGSWFLTPYQKQNPIYALAYQLRDHLLNVLTTHQLSGEEYAVAAAILLGYDDSLPAYLRKGYVAAGAMHVLCVSGLHVGIVFLIFSFLLKPLKDKGLQGIIKTIFLLLTIWSYALITGLSPSIQRASLMISFVLLGRLFGRKGYALNSVAASAFILLLLNPHNLLEIGFQLSYAAVFGILLLHRPIASLLYFKAKIPSLVWDATALSFAAQLSTSPLVLYYFHQFPVYFWLSNLFLMPLSFIVIVTGMALLMLHYLPVIPALIGKALSAMVYVMNTGIQGIESLPMSVLKGLFISRIEFLALMLILVFLIFLVRKKLTIFAILASGFSLLILVSFTARKIDNSQQMSFVVYDINKQSAVDFIMAHDHLLLADSSVLQDNFSKEFFLEGNWVEKGLSLEPTQLFFQQEKYENEYFSKYKHLISFGGKLLLLWENNELCNDSLTFRPEVDWVLVRGKQRENLQQILNCYQPGMLILDGSVPYYIAQKWESKAIEKQIPLHYTKKDGAYFFDAFQLKTQ
ncbi:MAG: ComEC/Rec2 family competence protein [Bacteroidales bacterium]|jgi:competence protein ComEC|nr:ComEC/Rec2 family competence protein [Bacteroidales bacterium]MDN5350842.1 competence protein ComEC [Bacteroidales bacterium]